MPEETPDHTMKETPILFSAPMILAILEGRKSMTRRVAIPRYDDKTPCVHWDGATSEPVMCRHCEHGSEGTTCPFGVPGDRIWVKETFIYRLQKTAVIYRADLEGFEAAGIGALFVGWKPSIFMPRRFSRITLEITGVKVDRVQEISEEDANAEGCPSHLDCMSLTPARSDFAALWDSINSKRGFGWEMNPWVWAISFRRV